MLTTELEQATRKFETQKLREALELTEPVRTDASTTADAASTPVDSARTKRFRRELTSTDVSGVIVFLAGLAAVVVASLLYS